ncbi:MAG: undecaprenyl-diphosphate phosphatase [Defluviitaleaceae bacterium]|nr:undecaprenyl-diphosphate phosphatase [Defluviitaleaceae bacterium]MCL2274670.1 undecaprenyl-diphosphate phosphatase [Defluviitaleaceae bacterium]MCL2275769.1 undecaprenyl-diphosphate phosphatase [Defluviitaleaceae bacterium]
MSVFQAIILGIVQGITEFLPVSSSGHLVIMQRVFGMEEPKLTFDIVVHLGTLVSILVFFWKDIWALLKNPFSKMTGLLIVATLPLVVVGFFFRDVVEHQLRGSLFLAFAFIVTGLLMVAADYFASGKGPKIRVRYDRELTYVDALAIGAMQALALPPGISRSGTTLAAALGRGINRDTATRFIFFIGAIAIFGAGAMDALGFARGDITMYDIGVAPLPLIVGFIVSAVVGYFSIGILLRLLKATKLRYFSYYVWALAAFIFVDMLVLNLFF